MDETRKNTYRNLLYHAMLAIRPLQGFEWKDFLPWRLYRELRHKHRAGALANALHNLALYSAKDFEGFNETFFWREIDWLEQIGCAYTAKQIRKSFEIRLNQLNDPENQELQRQGGFISIPYYG